MCPFSFFHFSDKLVALVLGDYNDFIFSSSFAFLLGTNFIATSFLHHVFSFFCSKRDYPNYSCDSVDSIAAVTFIEIDHACAQINCVIYQIYLCIPMHYDQDLGHLHAPP